MQRHSLNRSDAIIIPLVIQGMSHKKAKKHHNSSSSKKLHIFDWGMYLDSTKSEAVPVTSFKHVSNY